MMLFNLFFVHKLQQLIIFRQVPETQRMSKNILTRLNLLSDGYLDKRRRTVFSPDLYTIQG
ncbi:hypothetical protein Hanom_Chr02g00173611 [Helianthus anomalus]